LLVALWPGFALAQSRALIEANKQGNALYAQGRYAEPFARRALDLAEREFGASNPTTAKMLNNLATLYNVRGRYAEVSFRNRPNRKPV